MATSWYVKTRTGERGPFSFQRVAGLIQQGELQPMELVRSEDSAEWQTADSVIGLLRAARRQAPIPEPVVARTGGVDIALESATQELSERDRWFRDAQARILEEIEEAPDRPMRTFGRNHLLIAFMLAILLGGLAFGGWRVIVPIDPLANKNFEDQ